MKKNRPKVAKSAPDPFPDAPPPVAKHYYTREELDEIVAGTVQSIDDTPAWKDMVRRVGRKEARRILKLGLLANQLPASSPKLSTAQRLSNGLFTPSPGFCITCV